MSQIPRVALFKPDSELDQHIRPLFQKKEYSIRVVKNHAEAESLIIEEAASFDTIIVPLQLADGSSGISACIQSKASQPLSSVPIIAICPSAEKAILNALYGAGADIVVSLPINDDAFFLQLTALTRMQRNFREQLNKSIHETGLVHPVVQAFHSMREGFLLFNPTGTLEFANQSARAMLGIAGNVTPEAYQRTARQFKPVIKEHDAAVKLENFSPSDGAPTSSCDVTLYRMDNQTFRTMLTITSVLQESGELIGFSIALTNLAEIHHLGNTLVQAQRTRSLCLTMSAAALKLLAEKSGGMLLSPYKAVEELIGSSPRSCALDRSLAALLETMDLVVNPAVIIRVRVERDLNIAISESDFFVLMGHIVLHAVEHAGTTGEISIHSSDNIPGQGVVITVASEAQKSAPYVLQDQISQLIRSDFSNVSTLRDLSDKFSFGLYVAQSIAERYRTMLEYQESADTVIRIRVRLPVSAGAGTA